MFSTITPSSPVLEMNNLNFNYEDYGVEPMEHKISEADISQMVNQYYVSQQLFGQPDLNKQQLASPNYQYSVFQQPPVMHQDNNYPVVYQNTDASFISPQMDDMTGSSTVTSSSATSELDSLNLQFIHPQDVVNFTAAAFTPPTVEEFDSRRGSLLLEPALVMPLQHDQQHHQRVQQHQVQQHQHSQQLMMDMGSMPTTEDLLSSVGTTPIVSDIPHPLNFAAAAASIKAEDNTLVFSDDAFSSFPNTRSSPSFAGNSSDIEVSEEEDGEIPEITEIRKYRVVRGISAGGCSTRPPKEAENSLSRFAKVKLHLSSAGLEDMCLPKWNESEKSDRRRIIRIERRQNSEHIVASFSIVGSAIEHPEPEPAQEGVDFIEVSCLETIVDDNFDDNESLSTTGSDFGDETIDDFTQQFKQESKPFSSTGGRTLFYITSVEVIRIVELLIGSEPADGADRRRERGRVRSNLVPFWSRKPVSSKKTGGVSQPDTQDFRVELAQRIMGYNIRKPRGFDKEVRILKWEKLVPALKRALQSYYVEIPEEEY